MVAMKDRTCADCEHLDVATLKCSLGMNMAASRCFMFRQIEEAPIEDAPGQMYIFEEEEEK